MNTSTSSPRLVSINRSQLLLCTVDVERLIDNEHSARAIWELVGRLDLSLYHAQISAVEGRAGREHTDPQLLISLWLYAYNPAFKQVAIARRWDWNHETIRFLFGSSPA